MPPQPPTLNLRVDTDHWLAERMKKFQPRFSARRDKNFVLNGRLSVHGEKIVCTHIAKLWEEEFLRTAGKPSYQTLSSPTALRSAAAALALKDRTTNSSFVCERVDQTQYWMTNDWGQVLSDNFTAMSLHAGGDAAVCRTLYLLTPNHAMALGLKIKDSGGARRFVVQLYDPNNTISHRRLAITAEPAQTGIPAEIRQLAPRDFLSGKMLKWYRFLDAENRPIPTLFAGEKVGPEVARLAGNLPDLNEHVMHFLLAFNLPELHACADQLLQVDDRTRLKVLQAKAPNGSPGLYYAFQRGNAEVIDIFGAILKTSLPSLSPKQLTGLLAAKDMNGYPGLYAGLQRGHAKTIKAFGEILKAFQQSLAPEQLTDILSAIAAEGTPGLYAAFQDRHTEAIKVFGQILTSIRHRLSPEQLTDLLSARASDGTSALYFAFKNGDAETLEAFGEILKAVAAGLSSEQLMDLLSAKAGNDTPGLYTALMHGHAETLQVFGEILKTVAAGLSSDQLMDLLSANDKLGTPGLYFAFVNGHAKTIKIFGEILKTVLPRLSPEQLSSLLSAKDRNGIPGLCFALNRGYTEVGEAFAGILETVVPRLSPEQLADLLAAKSGGGYPVLYLALKSGNTRLIKTYGELLTKVAPFLPSDRLAEILAAKDPHGQPGIESAYQHEHVEAIAAFENLLPKLASYSSTGHLAQRPSRRRRASGTGGIAAKIQTPGLHFTARTGHANAVAVSKDSLAQTKATYPDS